MSTPKDLDPTGRFSNRAGDYVRHRPTYPARAVDAILAGLGPPATVFAVDVGAGTGISARLLAERGLRVVAVEPNRAMRDAATAHPGVSWVEGTAESIPLADGVADLVLVAQAFHWFRAEESVRELGRITKPGGRLALVWNVRSPSDPLMQGYEQAILATGADPKLAQMHADVAAVERSGAFGPRRVERFEHRQPVDRAGLLGRARSASYVPKEGPALAVLEDTLTKLHAAHADVNGLVQLVYETEVMLAERL